MDFTLSKEHEMARGLFKEFAENEAKPLAQEIDETERFSSEKLSRDLVERGKNSKCIPNADEIVKYVAENASSGDVILIMSNGGFDNIHEKLLEELKKK